MNHRLIAIVLLSLLCTSVLSSIPSIFLMEGESPLGLQKVEAVSVNSLPKLIERGQDYAKYDLGNGILRAEIGLPDWVYDNATSKYVPHKVNILNATYVEVQSGLIGWKIGRAGAIISDPTLKDDRTTEKWLPFLDSGILNDSFISHSVVDNSTGVYVTNHYATVYKGSNVTIDLIYATPDGQPTERIVKFTGLSDVQAKNLKIERQWDLTNAGGTDSVNIDGSQDTVDNTTKSKQKDSSTLKSFARFQKGGKMLVQENLVTAGDKLQKVDYSRNKVAFTYSGWTNSSSVVLVDDTTAITTVTQDGDIQTNAQTGTSCGSSTFTKTNQSANTASLAFAPASSTSQVCSRGYIEWNTSVIPDTATITNVTMTVDVSLSTNARPCDINPMQFQPSTQTAATVFADIGNGTSYLSNSNFCTTATNNVVVPLGSSAMTDLQNLLAFNWFSVGTKYFSEVRDASNHQQGYKTSENSGANPKPTLTVVYSAVTVTIPIQLSARAGTTTPFTANFTVSGAGCTGSLTHDGSPSSKSYSCYGGATITVTAPVATSNSRYVFSDGSTSKTFQSCNAGVCSTTTFSGITQQFNVTTTSLSGLDNRYYIKPSYKNLGATSDQPVFGGSDYYLNFVNGQVNIGRTWKANALSELTMCEWFQRDASDLGTYSDLIGSNTFTDFALLRVEGSTNANPNALMTQATYSDSSTSGEIEAGTITDTNWHQACTQFKKNDTIKLWLDGSMITSTAAANKTLLNSAADMFVARRNTGGDPLTGNVHNIAIWNSTSVSISDVYSGIIPAANLQVWQRYDEGSGTSATDYSGHGNTGTISSATYKRGIWADQGQTITYPATVTVSSTQRFESYNSTAQRSFTVTGATTKSYTFQNEYLMTPRVHETHLGDIFSPMPLSIYTGTITSSNSTATSISFTQQVTDDYMQPSQSYWFKNGTTSWSNMSWRGIVANATGSTSITAAGNFDIQSAVKHYGILPGNYHFRYGVDGGTTSTMTFDSLNANIAFNGTASSGTHSVVVEFLPQLYSGVRSITINGEELPIANYVITTDTSLSPIVSVLTINNVHFSTDSIVIVFQAASTSSGSGSEGGGGGGSLPVQNPPTGSSLALSIEPVTITISPGETQTSTIKLTWQGATKIVITNVQFIQRPEWFRLQQALPAAAVLSMTDNSARTEVPFSVALPSDYSGPGETVEARVTAITGSSQVMQSVPVTFVVGGTGNYALYLFVVIGLVGVVAFAAKHRKR